MNVEPKQEKEDGNVFAGLFWGILFSIPLWLSFFGWIKLIHHFLIRLF